MGKERIIFHVDVNSAFLSWSAVDRLNNGEEIDLRDIPAIIGHDEGRGVVLAKSELAKKYKIVTGESIFAAKRKCPNVVIVRPDFKIYNHFSNAMMDMLGDYTPHIEQYSIDECFMDMTNYITDTAVKTAYDIKKKIFDELGFTVNVGISSNKILAKMASELRKPNMVHTLFKDEIKAKMWPLQVGELFMVGRRSVGKLNEIGIFTIGDLATYNEMMLKKIFKSYGATIWNYANGIDNSEVESSKDYCYKTIIKSITYKRISTGKIELSVQYK